MKLQISNYTFNASAQTVTFTGYTSIRLDSILLITNVTDNIIIYNFADPALGGTVANNVLTLTYNTATMSNTDRLQIWYEDTAVVPSTVAKQQDLQDVIEAVQFLASQLSYLAGTRNLRGFPQVAIDTSAGALSVTSSSLGIANFYSYGGNYRSYFTETIVPNDMNQTAILSNINNVVVS